jgi:hypothetical protein
MPRTVFHVGGDSYPVDEPGEVALRAALENEDTVFVSHREIFKDAADPEKPGGLDVKLTMLEHAIRGQPSDRDIFLIGRSSGARVITLLADRCRVTATVCYLYPFQSPEHVLEPERFAHLATLATPTLLIQGANDAYGGIGVTENYLLSKAIRPRFVIGDHGLKLTAADNAGILRWVRDFIAGDWRDPSLNLAGFDEAFYLRTYPDVAKAIQDGSFPSGRDHFERHGRDERRRFRMRIERSD